MAMMLRRAGRGQSPFEVNSPNTERHVVEVNYLKEEMSKVLQTKGV
jgi:hypothetical protein